MRPMQFLIRIALRNTNALYCFGLVSGLASGGGVKPAAWRRAFPCMEHSGGLRHL
jgi:hypothetical protein